MPKLFISYRRDDSSYVAGRIYDRLVITFGKKSVFLDVDTIPPGSDFRQMMCKAVGRSDVVLCLMGKRWIGATDQAGERKLDKESDPVRVEIEAALQGKTYIIPVFVDGASAPAPEALPESLRDLSFRNGIAVRSDHDFHGDMDRLVDWLRRYKKPRHPSVEPLAGDVHWFLDGQPVPTPAGQRLSRRAWLVATTVSTLGSVGAASAAVRVVWRNRPIRVGVLQSQTEFMGDEGRAVINATLAALDEVNQGGGLLGRTVEPIVADGQSDEVVFVREARRLLEVARVRVLFGCLTSTHRRAVEPVVKEHNGLLVYPGESEGLDLAPRSFAWGRCPTSTSCRPFAGSVRRCRNDGSSWSAPTRSTRGPCGPSSATPHWRSASS